MSKATDQLADKEYYHDLTKKQKSVIDAYAERPESSHTAILRMANAKLQEEGLSVTRAYVPVVLDKYEDIAEEQKMKTQNSRSNGDAIFVGEPVIPEEMQDIERRITIALTPSEINSMADDDLPQSVRLKLLRPFLK